MFKLEFRTDNAAFDNNKKEEISRILREIAGSVYQGYTEGIIRDINGNIMGRYELTQTPNVELGPTSSDSCRLSDIVDGVRNLVPEELIDEFDQCDENEPDYDEAQSDIFTEICEHLNEIAPEGAYFGTHESDGACYGFWKTDDTEEV